MSAIAPTTRTLRVIIDTPYDESPDISWLDQTAKELGSLEAAVANRRRKLAYERGDWHLIGVRLIGEIHLHHSAIGWRRCNEIEIMTPGVWGIESDSDSGAVREIARGEAEYLREDLQALGFSTEEIDEAVEEAFA